DTGDSGEGQGEGQGNAAGGNSTAGGGHQHARGVGAGNCGSCADGRPRDYELPPDDPEHPGLSKAEIEATLRQMAQDIQKHRGSVPGYWKRWAEEFLAPRVNWRRELRYSLSRTLQNLRGQTDFSYSRPKY